MTYSIRPDPTSIKIGLCFLPVLAAAAAQWLLGRRGAQRRAAGDLDRGRLLRLGGGAAYYVLALGVLGISSAPGVPGADMTPAVLALGRRVQLSMQYGYTPSLVASVQLVLWNPVVRAGRIFGYDADRGGAVIAGRAAGYGGRGASDS